MKNGLAYLDNNRIERRRRPFSGDPPSLLSTDDFEKGLLKIILTTPTPHISKKYDPEICHKMRGRMA